MCFVKNCSFVKAPGNYS
uniref:Uncharacterized protein n=1 Tax=Rhizophora mucronata TaxID=61149 RepID=A0A2P2R4W4_RHIMU